MQVLVSQHRCTEPLTDGRLRQTFDVLGRPGLMVRWEGWVHGHGELSTDCQYYEVNGQTFDDADSALAAWAALAPVADITIEASDEPKPLAAHSDRDDVKSRRLISRSLIPSRLKALDDAHLPYEQIAPGHYRVYGEIEYYPATGFWRALNAAAHGYTVETLIAQARKRDEKPVDVDAVATAPTLDLSDEPHRHAETSTGDHHSEIPEDASGTSREDSSAGSGVSEASDTGTQSARPPSSELLPRPSI